jgi:hypothetical protein
MKDERLKFIVRKDQLRKKDGKYPINIRATINSKTLKLSAGICMELADWNLQTGFPKRRKDLINIEVSSNENYVFWKTLLKIVKSIIKPIHLEI